MTNRGPSAPYARPTSNAKSASLLGEQTTWPVTTFHAAAIPAALAAATYRLSLENAITPERNGASIVRGIPAPPPLPAARRSLIRVDSSNDRLRYRPSGEKLNCLTAPELSRVMRDGNPRASFLSLIRDSYTGRK